MKERNINADELSAYLKSTGKTFPLAMERHGIVEGNGKDHSQPCPHCGGSNRFWYSADYDSFFCRKCPPPSGQKQRRISIYDLEAHHFGMGNFPEVLERIAVASGYSAGYVNEKPKSGTGGKPKRFNECKTPHVYHNESGKEVYRIIRTDYTDESGKPGKTFCPAYQDDTGKTIYREYGVHYPYQLPDVLQAKTLFIVEGEKCCDAVNAMGIKNVIATTSQGGAKRGSLWKEFLRLFPSIAEKRIRIFPDNDEGGREYARTVAIAFLTANPLADVKIVELPGLPPKGDFCDWYKVDIIDEGKDGAACVETLSALCKKADSIAPETIATWNQPAKSESAMPESAITHRDTGVAILDSILAKIEPVDWSNFCTTGRNDEKKPPSEKVYILRTIERILETATGAGTPIVDKQKQIYCFTGTHYRAIADSELQNFLIESAIRCGVPNDTAIYQLFVERLTRQFYINASRTSDTAEPDTAFINLKNGTLFFDKGRHRFEPHTPERFIRYVLDFDYNPKATAPRWQQHLDRSLPLPDKQRYLAQCLALPFYKGKIEKAPILYGRRDTGKSTTLDVYKALVGMENISTETLSALTQADYHGLYARARLDGKLVNIASDISKKISDEGLAKTLISREAVSARRPNKDGFDMRDYARLVFAMNELPPQFFSDAALTKRAAIIEFDQQVAPQEKDTDFAEKLIADELPGVLNWIIAGLTRLNALGRLDAPPCCVEAMDRIRKETDPLFGWLEEQNYHIGSSTYISVKDAYAIFTEFCRENGNHAASKKTFTRRLRDAGYKVDRQNNHVGVVLYYTNSFLKNESPQSPQSPPLENKAENGDLSGTETGTDFSGQNQSPDESPISPRKDTVNPGTGTNGTVGTENSGKSFDVESGDNPPCCESCKRPCRGYSPSPAGCGNHQAKEGAF